MNDRFCNFHGFVHPYDGISNGAVCEDPVKDHMQACEDYLNARTGCYEWRCQRYGGVYKVMEHALSDRDLVCDVGAGWTELDVYLRSRGWRGRYWPVDGQFDGTDLESWVPPRTVDWFLAIEILEHLSNPARLIVEMQDRAKKGVILTTPNPRTTDVLGMDPTHKTPISADYLRAVGFHVEERSFYGQEDDSLLAFQVWQ